MTLQQILDKFCLSRSKGCTLDQLRLANELVDLHIPELLERYADAIIERNKAREEAANTKML